jgi:NTP pyrophosphatase (non-canonical NTP hydrolase)
VLTLNDYQKGAIGTAIYPGKGEALGLSYVALKMNGEAGEFAEHLGKAIRDDAFGQPIKRPTDRPLLGVTVEVPTGEIQGLTPERHQLLAKELGDVLWYVAAAAEELGLKLGDIAQANLDKLASRKARGVLGGSGDNR